MNSPGLVVPSQHLSLKVPQAQWFVASLDMVRKTETRILLMRKQHHPGVGGEQGGWEELGRWAGGRCLQVTSPSTPWVVPGHLAAELPAAVLQCGSSVVFLWRNTGEAPPIILKTHQQQEASGSLQRVLTP